MGEGIENRLMEISEIFARGDLDQAFDQMAALEATFLTERERSQLLARYASFFHILDLQEEELSAIAQALILDPTNPRAHYLNAIHLMIDERWEDATTALNRAARYYAVDDHVHLAEVYGNLSYCWAQMNDPDRAQMYEEICAELDPDDDPEPEESLDVWPEAFEIEVEPLGDGDASATTPAEIDTEPQKSSERITWMMEEYGRHSRGSGGLSQPRSSRRKDERRKKGPVTEAVMEGGSAEDSVSLEQSTDGSSNAKQGPPARRPAPVRPHPRGRSGTSSRKSTRARSRGGRGP